MMAPEPRLGESLALRCIRTDMETLSPALETPKAKVCSGEEAEAERLASIWQMSMRRWPILAGAGCVGERRLGQPAWLCVSAGLPNGRFELYLSQREVGLETKLLYCFLKPIVFFHSFCMKAPWIKTALANASYVRSLP